jgi:hypothetical protein
VCYTISSTEKLNESASSFETASLLYLITLNSNRNKMHYYFIDLFNDVTSMTEKNESLFDVQSKNDKNMSPKKLGRYLVTLFKNYVSSIEFDSYYLTLPCDLNEKNIKKNVNSKSKTAKIIDYLHQDALRRVEEGLFEEINDKTYLSKYAKNNSEIVIKEEISKFLSKTYVVILSVEHEQLVLNFLENKSLDVDKNFLKNIFNEIRDAQNKLKQINVENLTINIASEAVDLKKHFVSEELRTLVFNRIIMLDFCTNAIPSNFSFYIMNTHQVSSEWELKELHTLCIDAIRKTLFDKNSKRIFWTTFCELYNLILNNSDLSIVEIYQKLERSFINKMKFLRDSDDKYIFFIALIQNGVKEYLEKYEN